MIPPLRSDYESWVARGIELLDRQGPPNWRDRIDLGILDISDETCCILGQVYGSYINGLEALRITTEEIAAWIEENL